MLCRHRAGVGPAAGAVRMPTRSGPRSPPLPCPAPPDPRPAATPRPAAPVAGPLLLQNRRGDAAARCPGASCRAKDPIRARGPRGPQPPVTAQGPTRSWTSPAHSAPVPGPLLLQNRRRDAAARCPGVFCRAKGPIRARRVPRPSPGQSRRRAPPGRGRLAPMPRPAAPVPGPLLLQNRRRDAAAQCPGAFCRARGPRARRKPRPPGGQTRRRRPTRSYTSPRVRSAMASALAALAASTRSSSAGSASRSRARRRTGPNSSTTTSASPFLKSP